MIFLSATDWPYGQKRNILSSKVFNLEVFATRENPKAYRQYNTKLDTFLLSIDKLDPEKNEKDNTIIKFSDINFLESIIRNFYKRIIQYYKSPKPNSSFQCQMDISLNNLNLKYLRSGLFKADSNFEDIIKILLSQLLSAFRSDDNLLIDHSFKIYLTVTNMKNTFPTFKPVGLTQRNLSLANQLMTSQFMATKTFFDLIKRGIVDLGQINKAYNKINCTFLNLSFAYFMRSKNIPLLRALDLYTDSGLNYFTKFMSYFKLDKIDNLIETEKQSLFNVLENISRRIRRAIIVICPSKQFTFNNEIIFMSKNRQSIKNHLPIYLILTQEVNDTLHISFAFDFKIKRNSNLFCQVCTKSVSHKFHNCLHPVCFLCQRYMSKYSLPFTKDICRKLIIKNVDKKCEQCKNVFENEICFENHMKNKLSAKICLPYHKCEHCNIFIRQNFKKSNHICFVKFCTKCKKMHKTTDLCYISSEINTSKKIGHKNYFLHISFSYDKEPIFASVTNINDAELHETIFLAQKKTFFDQKDLLKNWESPHEFFCVNSVFNYFEKLKCQKQNLTIFCDSTTFNFLCAFICNENSTLQFAKSGLSSFKLKFNKKIIKYRKLDSIIDSKIFELAYYCNKNMILIQMPVKFTKEAIFMSELTSLNLSDFNLEYIGSCKKMYDKLLIEKAKFEQLKGKTNILFLTIANNINEIYLSSIYHLSKMFSKCQTNLCTPQNVSILSFPTLSSAGNYILRSKLEQNTLPVMNHKYTNIRFNTSKLEILLAQTLSDLHFITCREKDKFYSFVTRDGKQFQRNQFSSDFYCQKCFLIYFVEGKFKIDFCAEGCKIDSEKTFFGMDKSYLSQKAKKNRQKMIDLCANKKIQCIVFNECCFEKNNLSVLSQHIENHLQKFKIPNKTSKLNYLINNFKQRKLNYSKEIYERLDTTKCIDAQMIEFNYAFFNVHPESKIRITKYDMNNAYASQLEKLRLPFRDAGTTYLFDEANELFNEMIEMYQKGTFQCNGYGRAKVLAPKNKYTSIMPFLGFFSSKHDTTYLALCQKCALLKSNSCNHTTKERSFFVQSTLETFLFAKCVLNYEIIFTEILFFKHCKSYKEIFDSFQTLSHLRLECKFYSYFAKRILLQGLGSYSTNRANFNNIYTVSNKSALDSSISEKNLLFKSFRFVGKEHSPHCIIEKSNKSKKAQFFNKSHTLLFAASSNNARILLYQNFMHLLDIGCKMIRFDSDSLSFAYHSEKQNEVDKILAKKFKIESEDIESIISFKKRSYVINNFDKNKSQIKVCGMSLNFNQRFNTSTFQDVLTNLKFKHRTKNKKSLSRILDKNMTYLSNFNYLKSYPFG